MGNLLLSVFISLSVGSNDDTLQSIFYFAGWCQFRWFYLTICALLQVRLAVAGPMRILHPQAIRYPQWCVMARAQVVAAYNYDMVYNVIHSICVFITCVLE